MPQLGKRKDYRLSTNKKFSVRERKRLLKYWKWESLKRMTYGLKTGYYLPDMLREELRKLERSERLKHKELCKLERDKRSKRKGLRECERSAEKKKTEPKKLWLKKAIDKITK
jgi:hypothetical protein